MSEGYGETVYTGFWVVVLLAFSPVLIAVFVVSVPFWLAGKIVLWGLGGSR